MGEVFVLVVITYNFSKSYNLCRFNVMCYHKPFSVVSKTSVPSAFADLDEKKPTENRVVGFI